MKTNFHTHSRYCDGHGELRDYVEYALARGFSQLGFSGHAPMPIEDGACMSMANFERYVQDARALQREYADRIALFLGLEIDYVPGVQEDFAPLVEKGGLDYCIGSVHHVNDPRDPANLWMIDGSKQEVYDEGLQRVFGGDMRRGLVAFFRQNNEMIERNRPTIVGHFNKIVMHNRDRYFLEDDRLYLDLAHETIALIAETGCLCEVNTRGIYKKRHNDYYPSRDLLRHMKEKRIPVIVSSDAHDPSDLDRFEGAHEFLREIGYKDVVYSIR